jgi:hypothetical protein
MGSDFRSYHHCRFSNLLAVVIFKNRGAENLINYCDQSFAFAKKSKNHVINGLNSLTVNYIFNGKYKDLPILKNVTYNNCLELAYLFCCTYFGTLSSY